MCDVEGNQYLLLAGIVVDHRKDASALDRADMYIKHGSNRHMKKTNKGWKLCIEWKDGSTSWERLADLKESNPVKSQNMQWLKESTPSLLLHGGSRLP
jgi:hypothetical protein